MDNFEFSKIRDLYVELQDYKYFHKPSSEGNLDHRILGRKREKERLEKILTNSDSESGTYLITGFRGMGKTSLVNDVISRIRGNIGTPLRRYGRVYLALLFISPFSAPSPANTTLMGELVSVWVPAILFLISLVVLLGNGIGAYKTNKPSKRQILTFSEDYLLLSSVYWTTSWFTGSHIKPIPTGQLIYYFTVFHIAACVSIEIIQNLFRLFIKLHTSHSVVSKRSKWLTFFYLVREKLRGFVVNNILVKRFNYDNIVHIKINLGKDDISETYILRQLVLHLCQGYKRITRPLSGLHRIIWTLLHLVILYLITLFIYYQPGIYAAINDFRRHYVIDYLPSQSIFELIGSGDIVSKLGQTPFLHDTVRIDSISSKELALIRPINKSTDSVIVSSDTTLISFSAQGEFYQTLRSKGLFADSLVFFHHEDTLRFTSLGGKELFYYDQNFLISKTRLLKMKEIDSSYFFHQYPDLQTFRDSIYSLNRIQLIDSASNGVFHTFCNYADYIFFIGYQKLRLILSDVFSAMGTEMDSEFSKSSFFRVSNLSKDLFLFIPVHLDYFFILFYLISYLTLRKVSRLWAPFETHHGVYQRLMHLKKRLESEVTDNQSKKNGFKTSIIEGFRSVTQEQAYPIADFGTIESNLELILRQNSKIPSIFSRPKFVFIFDELDKIDPTINSTIQEKEEEELLANNRSRNRQQLVLKTLANLKHFFNTVDAKFIFIAGREMFDASLAGASDRESLIRSIFNDVIYIKSFYSDDSDNRRTNITSLTESYVCQFLKSYGEPNQYPRLKGFYEALHRQNYMIKVDGIEKDQYNNPDQYNKIKTKILFTLVNFITYLTYRSNGSPKNITLLFEEFVVSGSSVSRENSLAVIRDYPDLFINIFRKGLLSLFFCRSNKFYLRFTENDQYKIGLTTHLFTPFLNNQERILKNLEDKLLVSSSFLFDHLYKFHLSAFARRNLELTPDIININKAPELRNFIRNIVDHLTSYHLRSIVSGLYDFKFESKVKAEIHYISKVSELESAAFNFTLDESLLIKRHYKQRLNQELQKQKNQDQKSYYNNSIGYLQMLIGELHFYDQEYDEALNYFMTAIQELRNIRNQQGSDQLDIYNLSIFIRNSLKLGLTFEKQHNFDSALLAYSNLASDVIQSRVLSPSNFGIIERPFQTVSLNDIVRKHTLKEILIAASDIAENDFRDWSTQSVDFTIPNVREEVKKKFDRISNSTSDMKFEEVLQNVREYYDQNDDDREDFLKLFILKCKTIDWFDNSLFFRNEKLFAFSDNFFFRIYSTMNSSPELSRTDFKKSLFENLRLSYQASLAKLSLIEKGGVSGITFSDVNRTVHETYFLLRIVKGYERSVLLSEYYNKIGDILYYKNGLLLGTHYELDDHQYHIDQNTLPSLINELFSVSEDEIDNNRYYRAPISSFFYYFSSLYTSYYAFYSEKILTKDEVPMIKLGDKDITPRFLRSAFVMSPDNEFHDEEDTILNKLFEKIHKGLGSIQHTSSRLSQMNSFSNALSDVGDSYFSMTTGVYSSSVFFIDNSYETTIFKKLDETVETGDKYTLSRDPIIKAIVYYYLAHQFLKKAGKYRKAAIQITKILYLLMDVITHPSFKRVDTSKTLLGDIEVYVSQVAIELIHRSYDHSIRPERLRYSELAGIEFSKYWNEEEILEYNSSASQKSKHGRDKVYMDRKYIKHSSLSGSLKEVYYLKAEIGLALEGVGFLKGIQTNVHPYSSAISKFSRLHELFFKLNSNHERIKSEDGVKDLHAVVKNGDDNEVSRNEKYEEYLLDSIYCNNTILEILHTFGPSYLFVHSTFGLAHYSFGNWSKWLKSYLNKLGSNSIENEILANLNQLLDGENINHLNSSYQYQLAKEHFYKALQTHHEGHTYHKLIENMYYLDDDFNDDYYHFFTARERYRINSGIVEKKIRKIVKHLEKSETNRSSVFFKDYITD